MPEKGNFLDDVVFQNLEVRLRESLNTIPFLVHNTYRQRHQSDVDADHWRSVALCWILGWTLRRRLLRKQRQRKTSRNEKTRENDK